MSIMSKRSRSILTSTLIFLTLFSLSLLAAETAIVPEPETHKLENGLQVLLVPQRGVEIATVDLWVKAGSVNEDPENNGLSHFFEHMLFVATENRPPGTIDREVEAVGGHTNAATSRDYTHYFVNLPSSHLEKAIDILADITRHSTFPQAKLERERKVILRELGQREDDPGTYVHQLLWQNFFQQHPYRLPIGGRQESLQNITREDFLRYMEEYYVPSNMTLVVSGNFDRERALAEIKATFGQMEARPSPPHPSPGEASPSLLPQKEKKVVTRDVHQDYLILAWKAPSVKEKEEVYALDLLSTILSGGRTSRLYRNVYKDKTLVSAPPNAYFTTMRYPSIFYLYAQLPPENYEQAKSALLEELKKIMEEGLSEEELNRAKTKILSNYAFSNETYQGVASTLGYYATVAGDYRFALEYPQGIQSVTVEEIQKVLRKYVDTETYFEALLKPESEKGGTG